MSYIKQKTEGTTDIVIVNLTGYTGDLSQHPCVLHHPELFEVIDGNPPEKVNILNYSDEEISNNQSE